MTWLLVHVGLALIQVVGVYVCWWCADKAAKAQHRAETAWAEIQRQARQLGAYLPSDPRPTPPDPSDPA